MDPMRRLFAFAIALAAASALTASCGSSEETGGKTLCSPGENIFCRCRGGDAGTKTCASNGQSFDECVTAYGPCTEIPETTVSSTADTTAASTSDSSTTGATSSSGSSGTGGAPPEYAAYLEPCSTGSDCESGSCPMGYCTHECESYQDCIDGDTYGDCVLFVFGQDFFQLCVPYCNGGQSDCDVYGPPSKCDTALAVDGVPFQVCADWPDYGTDCADDFECSLGADGCARVCAFGACAEGCYVATDCPPGESCSSSGNLGQCQ